MKTHSKAATQLHFVGIGGIGMSGIAEVFLNQGYPVSGSDLSESDTTRRLRNLGARIEIGHRSENVGSAQVVVLSSAIRPSNPEWVEAKRLRVPIIPRAEMLAELMRGKLGVAVGGTHGKTTTTSLLSVILTEASLDPTLVIGGKVDSLGGNAKLGKGEIVVAEADESDGSFTHLPATFAVITNIDNDHLDHFGTLAGVEEAFIEFVGKLPFYGAAVVCGDDSGVRRCLGRFTKPVVTYGFSADNDFQVTEVIATGQGSRFVLSHGKISASGRTFERLGELEIRIPGQHNVLNATAAAIISLRLGLKFEQVRQGLAAFGGVKRRFEVRYQDLKKRITVVDDYGHHPTEVAATLAAARAYWPRPGRILVVFQPHRYSRTLNCRDGFLGAFHQADLVFLTDIYAAGEAPIDGVSSELLAQDLQRNAIDGQTVQWIGPLESAAEAVLADLRPGDLVLCMGAGSITRLPDSISQGIQKKSAGA